MTTFLLDTNTVSYFVSGRSPAVRTSYLAAEVHATIAISALTEGEIRFGLAKRPQATRLTVAFEHFFDSVQVLGWDSETARVYGRLRAALAGAGKVLSVMDLLIASQAIASGATLVSHDRAFQVVQASLRVVDWATDL